MDSSDEKAAPLEFLPEEERKKCAWASKPQIRKYDAVYNGRLNVSISGARTFRDRRSYVLEDRLGNMMLVIYEKAERMKQVRLAREEAERQRQEQDLSEWASWVRAKADRYDPAIAKKDELLGRREYEKDQENKGPKHKGCWH